MIMSMPLCLSPIIVNYAYHIPPCCSRLLGMNFEKPKLLNHMQNQASHNHMKIRSTKNLTLKIQVSTARVNVKEKVTNTQIRSQKFGS